MADIIDKTTINLDSLTLGGNPSSSIIYVKLESNATLYKTNTIIKSVEFSVVPDSLTGVATVDLIETDNMEGNQKYIFNFGDGVVYRASIPYSETAINFFDLPSLERSAFDREWPFKGEY